MARASVCVLFLSALPASTGCTALIGSLGSSSNDAELEDDSYKEEPEQEAVEVQACGAIRYPVSAIQTGSDQWGPFEAGWDVNPYYVRCDEIPEQDEFDGVLADVVADIRDGNKKSGKGVVTWDGKFEVKEGEDLRLHKTASITYYSPKVTFKNTCGDPDLTCESSGPNAWAVIDHNRLYHSLDRADLHRKAGNAKQCAELLDNALRSANSFHTLHDKKKEEGTGWIPGVTYRVRGGKKLSEKKLVAKIKAGEKQAKQRLEGGWCQKE
jgi:hypothetical protein